MATASETISRWTRGFVAAGVLWFVVWQAAVVAGLGRRVTVTLALYGFVLHVVFGKAYSLVPSYFDRDLRPARGPTLHLPCALLGTAGLAAGALPGVPTAVRTAGALLWAAGVAVFLPTLGWTVRDNLTGAETGTGDHNADRRPVDRVANLGVPVVLLYLAAGAYVTVAATTPLPVPVDGYPPRVSHLLAAGVAALLLVAVGFRLLPRFLVASVPIALAVVAVPAAALGPALIAVGLPAGPVLHAGAGLETLGIGAFAVAYWIAFARSDRSRIGFYGVLAGTVAGVAVVGLGLHFAVAGPRPDLVSLHYRLALLGFLGLSIVGVTYQFYPPSVCRFPLAGDRFAAAVLAAVVVGLALEALALVLGRSPLALAGRAVAALAAVGYAYLLLGLFVQRWRD
jgi:hypothetical protein